MGENINWSEITSIKIGFEIYLGRSFKTVTRLVRWFDTELKGEYSFTNDLKYLILDLKKFNLVIDRLCGHSGYNLYREDFIELWIDRGGDYLKKPAPMAIPTFGNNVAYIRSFSNDGYLSMNFTTGEFGDLSTVRLYLDNINTHNKYQYDIFCENHPDWVQYLYLIGFLNIEPPQKA